MMSDVDLAQERDAAVRRNRLKTYPGRLLFMVSVRHETEHVPRAEIRAVAAERWSDLPAADLDEIVDRAIAERDAAPERGRRIDPETVDLKHPSRRDGTMATKEQVYEAVRAEIERDPKIDYYDLNVAVCKRLGTEVSRSQTSQWARRVLDELKEQPSTNGARPPAPEPSAAEAEPDLTPATDATEEERLEDSEPGEQLGPAGLEPALTTSARSARVQVDVHDGRARLFVDLDSLPPALAYRLAAQLQLGLAEEAA